MIYEDAEGRRSGKMFLIDVSQLTVVLLQGPDFTLTFVSTAA